MGGGPAGLTASYQLGKAGIPSVVLEKDGVVGGLARTVDFNGYRFDIGGHRFFTKVPAVEEIWREILSPEDFPRRRRLSRIYYDGHYFPYPLRLWTTLRRLGLVNSVWILASYLRSRLFPFREEKTFEQWVCNRFGRRLYRLFFRTYTEKVWGMPCGEISAEWAAQRIRGLSLSTALRHAMTERTRSRGKAAITTLVEEFDYPRLGPGMMWERAAEAAVRLGGEVRKNARVSRIFWNGDRVDAVEITAEGPPERITGSHFFSTMPIPELIEMLDPPAPPEVRSAAARLRHRDFLTVAVVVSRAQVFPDNWIYVHDPSVKVGRIQNFKNWSPEMVPDAAKTCLGLEYFCFENDALWSAPDDELVALATRELVQLGLVRADEIEAGTVVRMPKAYPVYDATHQESLRAVREFTDGVVNLQLLGRNGTHRYNNQDHSMLTAMLAVRNVLGEKHDLWSVNAEPAYLEETAASDRLGAELSRLNATQPRVPRRAWEA